MDNFIEYYKCGGKTKTPSKPKKVKSCACGSKIKKSNAPKKSTKSAKLKIAAKGMKMKGCGCGSKLYRVGGRIVEMDCNNIIKAQTGAPIDYADDPRFSGKYDENSFKLYPIKVDKAPKDNIYINYLDRLIANPDAKTWSELENYSKMTKNENPLTKEIQKYLNLLGDYSGPIDGIFRPEIKKAIKRRNQKDTMLQLNPSISTLDVKSSEKKPTVPVVEDLNERPDLLSDEIYMPENRLSYRRQPLEY